MKYFAFAILLGICLVASGEDPKIIDPVDASEAAGADEDPKGDAKPPSESRRGGGGGEGGALAAENRHLGFSFPYIDTCPAYRYYKLEPRCPRGSYCQQKRCYFTVAIGYYCGLPFYLYHQVSIGGNMCRSEYKNCHSSPWMRCRCRTKWCWFKLKRVIKHNGKLYIVVVYIRRPCGCECLGRRIDFQHQPHILEPIDHFNPFDDHPF